MAANRDEFHERSTAHANWWNDHPNILGGRDLEKGGTWMAVNKNGKFVAITNYRKFPITEKYNTSRGDVVKDFLTGSSTPNEYLNLLQQTGNQYDGFNLLFGDQQQLHYYSNRGAEQANVEAGVHGLSNHLLNTPWPKVEKGKQKVEQLSLANPLSDSSIFFEALNDREKASDDQLPITGVSLEWERNLSPMFIEMDKYGTRCSTLLLIDRNNKVTYHERSYIPAADNRFEFQIK
jgi:uncharacterized protein with NRDE domain